MWVFRTTREGYLGSQQDLLSRFTLLDLQLFLIEAKHDLGMVKFKCVFCLNENVAKPLYFIMPLVNSQTNEFLIFLFF